MEEQFLRTAMLLGEEGVKNLSRKRVAVFGVGGVGGHVVEALARSGVGAIDLIDNDIVNPSNINRQLIATWDTVGRQKTEVMKERVASINPRCLVETHNLFFLPEREEELPFDRYDYIVDAIDTVTAKIALVMIAQERNIPIISSMGTGNKLDPTKLEITDLYATSTCPLAKVMRRELKRLGVKKLTVLYSTEVARKPLEISGEGETVSETTDKPYVKRAPGSNAFVPACAGLMIGGYVVLKLSGAEK